MRRNTPPAEASKHTDRSKKPKNGKERANLIARRCIEHVDVIAQEEPSRLDVDGKLLVQLRKQSVSMGRASVDGTHIGLFCPF